MDEFEIVDLVQEDLDEVLSLIETAYTPREPLSLGFHYAFKDLLPLHTFETKLSIEKGCAIGLRNNSGKLIGLSLCLVVNSDSDPIYTTTYSSPECNLYNKVLTDFCHGIHHSSEEEGVTTAILDLLLLTVHPNYCNKGIATKLIE
ncbi:hypothetical protein SK128_000876, partial [Halocaridina rubra]